MKEIRQQLLREQSIGSGRKKQNNSASISPDSCLTLNDLSRARVAPPSNRPTFLTDPDLAERYCVVSCLFLTAEIQLAFHPMEPPRFRSEAKWLGDFTDSYVACRTANESSAVAVRQNRRAGERGERIRRGTLSA